MCVDITETFFFPQKNSVVKDAQSDTFKIFDYLFIDLKGFLSFFLRVLIFFLLE